jgi:glycosyltransferase involved in cell wall biosynthesis
LPTVSTDCDGVVDIVVAGETGLMVPPRDPERLAAAVRSLLADPGRRRRMGEAGADRVRHRFSEERMDADLEILYTRLVAERAARRR